MPFKFEMGQQVWLAANGHPVTVAGRTEFMGDRQNRYYVTSDTAIPGKNVGEDWINEGGLTNVEPKKPEPEEAAAEEVKAPKRVPAVSNRRKR